MASGAVVLAACAPGCTGGCTGGRLGTAAAPAAAGTPVLYWYAWANLDPAIERSSRPPRFKEHMGGAQLNTRGTPTQAALLDGDRRWYCARRRLQLRLSQPVHAGATIPVQDLVVASTVIKQDNILEPLWRSAFIGEDMIGVPAIESYLWWGLNYNADAAEEAGLDPSTAAQDLGRNPRVAQGLTKKDDAGNLLMHRSRPVRRDGR